MLQCKSISNEYLVYTRIYIYLYNIQQMNQPILSPNSLSHYSNFSPKLLPLYPIHSLSSSQVDVDQRVAV